MNIDEGPGHMKPFSPGCGIPWASDIDHRLNRTAVANMDVLYLVVVIAIPVIGLLVPALIGLAVHGFVLIPVTIAVPSQRAAVIVRLSSARPPAEVVRATAEAPSAKANVQSNCLR